MTLVLSINSIKGGTLKTTNAVNLASCFADIGYRTLLVDMDPQGNATAYLGVDEGECESTITNLLIPEGSFQYQHKELEDVIVPIKENLYLIPSNLDLNDAIDFIPQLCPRPFEVLANILASPIVQELFDIVFLDNSPSWDILTKNCVYAADYVIGTSTFEYLSLKGIDFLIKKLPEVKKINTNLEYLGTIGGKATRSNHFKEVKQNLEDNFDLLKPIIPTGVDAADSVVEGISVNEYNYSGKVAVAYRELTKTVVDLLVEHAGFENKLSKNKWKEFINNG